MHCQEQTRFVHKGVGSRMPIIGPVDWQKKQTLITTAV